MRKIIIFAVTALITILMNSCSYAATYYISPGGSDISGNGSSASPWKTTTQAFTLGGGNTYIFKDGTYNYSGCEIGSIPNGTAQNYTIIKAENDGGAVITQSGGISLEHTNQYIQIEGFKFNYPYQKNILGDHIKFLRCAFVGGPASGNTMNTVVGTNDYSDTEYILLEDCWFYGSGGRYNLLVYNSDKVIVRRCVIRHDGGWDDLGSADPEAGLNFYNSADCLAQNVIVIDSNETYKTWSGGFYTVKNSSTAHSSNNNKWKGCIDLVGADLGLRFDTDSSITGDVVEDCVFWDVRNGGISFGGGGSVSSTINRVSIGRSQLTALGDFKGGIGSWNGGTKTITNAIIANWTAGSDLNGVSATFFDTYNNLVTSSGTGRQTYNPQTNGLSYLVRIEDGSSLKTNGSGGGQIGAQIMKCRGKSGTLYGETDYDSLTSENLWAWSYEDRIKNDMSAVSNRGFCASGKTLTRYIWEYLGNAMPPLVAPTDLNASTASSSSILLGWTDNSVTEGGFKIERKEGVSGSYAQVGTTAKDTFIYTDTGLNSSTTYYYKVRAYYDTDSSDYSNETFATTSALDGGGGDGGNGGNGGSGGGGGCFIATAAYGTSMAKEVTILTSFRDRYLLNNQLGRRFVWFYYKISPSLAKYIEDRPWVKEVTKIVLIPIVALCKFIMQKTYNG